MTSVIAPSVYIQNVRAYESIFASAETSYGQLILDLCTPLRLHMNQIVPNERYSIV
jgi:hypothetical protein